MKKILFSFLLFGILSNPAFAATEPSAAPVSAPSITAAHKLVSQGKLLDAQKAYEQILAAHGLSQDANRRAYQSYEKLNRRILFSKTATPDSATHEVVAGDSLIKIAKQYKTSPGLIKKANGLKNDTVFLGAKLKIPQGNFSIKVDKSRNVLELFFNDRPIKHYRVATGKNNGTPVGTFKITTKLENPTWYKTGSVVPPGSPENGLGTRWMGFDLAGYGIHGTIEPETIGTQATAGCVRMLNQEVEELYALIPAGTSVTITN